MNTLLLDRDDWDLTIDALDNIAMARAPYAILQDVASACRLFLGELYYGGAAGVSYFADVLGHPLPTSLLKSRLVEAALTVPGVISAEAFLTSGAGRSIGGQVQVVTDAGLSVVSL